MLTYADHPHKSDWFILNPSHPIPTSSTVRLHTVVSSPSWSLRLVSSQLPGPTHGGWFLGAPWVPPAHSGGSTRDLFGVFALGTTAPVPGPRYRIPGGDPSGRCHHRCRQWTHDPSRLNFYPTVMGELTNQSIKLDLQVVIFLLISVAFLSNLLSLVPTAIVLLLFKCKIS